MLDIADPKERAKAAEALIRTKQPVEFDLAKPPESRTLPGELIKALAEAKLLVVITGAVFQEVCVLDNVTFEAGLVLRQCAFTTLSAVNATFEAPIHLPGCTFQVCNFAYSELLEGSFQRVRATEFCSFEYATVHGFVDVSGSTLAALVLVGASIEGEIVANQASISRFFAQGMSVDGSFSAMQARFENQIMIDDSHFGALRLNAAVFDDVFYPARVEVDGPFDADGATFAKAVGIQRLSCATFSMQGATVTGHAALFDVDAENAMLRGAKFGGRLLVERGSVKGVFDVRGVSVAEDFIIERAELSDGANIAGVTAVSLQLLDVTAGDVFAEAPAADAVGGAEPAATRQSRFQTVIVRRSKLKSLRPAHWLISGDFYLQSSSVDFALFEDNEVGGFVVTSTKFRDACFLGRNTFHGLVAWTNVS
ncbi:MAG TPA: hypothetical protein VGT98_02355, partial [Candidatus Elarobacter sp.]|nr:hypothetical protein [Candidatus Elarobacter sp.]